MTQLEQYYRQKEKEFPAVLHHLKDLIMKDEDSFLNDENFFEPHPKLKPDISKLFRAYSVFMFYTNDQIIEKLKKEFGENRHLFKWFIPLNALEEQFNLINEKGILVDKVSLLQQLKIYLLLKFSHHFQKLGGKISENSNQYFNEVFAEEFEKYKERLKYRYDNPFAKVKEDEILFKNFFEKFTEEDIDVPFLEYYIKLLKGDVDFLLNGMFECFYNHENQIKKHEYYRSLYDFFKLIMLDSNLLPSEKEFKKNYNYYSKSYTSFKAVQIIKLYERTKDL